MNYGQRIQGNSSLTLRVATALPQHMRGKVIEVHDLRTHPDHRGNGEAHSLMLATTLEADMNNRFLLVCVEPGGDSPMDAKQLGNWYLSHGFVPIQSDPMLMIRPCAGRVAA